MNGIVRRSPRLLSLLALLAPFAAHAAGLDLPENGALPLARGGTAVSLMGTAYSLQFNPAGMSGIKGLEVRVDARFVSHAVGFKRESTNNYDFDRVQNSAGIFVGPAVHIAYGLSERFTVGLGIWGPPGVGKYQYPDPVKLTEEGFGSSDAGSFSGQRYALIQNQNQILFPSVGASFKVNELLSLGLTLQSAHASISFDQAIAAVSAGGTETTDLDAIVKLAVVDRFAPTLVAGVALRPMKGLDVGLSFRPKVAIHASGTMDIELPEIAKETASIEGNTATVQMNLPPIARAGATYAFHRFKVSGEASWEGWSANDKMVLTPDVTIHKVGADGEKMKQKNIVKDWKDSFGGRVGVSYAALDEKGNRPGIDVHLGGLFETNAIPSKTQNIDFVTGDRLGGSVGATARYKGFELTVGGMLYKPVTLDVNDSTIARTSADDENPPLIVGNGRYTSSAWVAAVGLAWKGLGPKQ